MTIDRDKVSDKTLVERLLSASDGKYKGSVPLLLGEAIDRINTLELEALGADIKIDDLERARAQPAEAVADDDVTEETAAKLTSDAAQGAAAWSDAGYGVIEDASGREIGTTPGWSNADRERMLLAVNNNHPTPDTTAAELLGVVEKLESYANVCDLRYLEQLAAELRTLAGKIRESGT